MSETSHIAKPKAAKKSADPAPQARGGAAPAMAHGGARSGGFYASGPALALGVPVQMKVIVGPSDDAYEREADAVADHVIAGDAVSSISSLSGSASGRPAQRLQRLCDECAGEMEEEEEPGEDAGRIVQRMCSACGAEQPDDDESGEEHVQRLCSSCAAEMEEESGPVRRKKDELLQPERGGAGPGGGGMSAAAHAVHNPAPGAPLQAGLRGTLESSLGVDLGDVRVHHDATAEHSASALGARAFTHGNHIWLGRGESPTDLRLMAHETTHVVQQSGADGTVRRIQRTMAVLPRTNDGAAVRARMQSRIDEAREENGDDSSTEATIPAAGAPAAGTASAHAPSGASPTTGPTPAGTGAAPSGAAPAAAPGPDDEARRQAASVDRGRLASEKAALQGDAEPDVNRGLEAEPQVEERAQETTQEIEEPPDQLRAARPGAASGAGGHAAGGVAGGAAGEAAGAPGAAGPDGAAPAEGAAGGEAGAQGGQAAKAGPGAEAAAAADQAASLAENAFSLADAQPMPDLPQPVVPPPPVTPVDAKGAPLPANPAADGQIADLAASAQTLREQGHTMRQHAAEELTNAQILRGNLGLVQQGIGQATQGVTTAQGHLEFRRGVLTQAQQALQVSETKAATVSEGAPRGVEKTNEGKQQSGPLVSESRDLAAENSANTPDDSDAAENAQEQGGKINQVGSDTANVDDAITQAQSAAGTLVQDAAAATQKNTQTRTRVTAAQEALDGTGERLGQMREQNAQAGAQVAQLQGQPEAMAAQAQTLDGEGAGLIQASEEMEARLAGVQQNYAEGMQSVPGAEQPRGPGGADALVQRTPDPEPSQINIGEGLPSWLTGEEAPNEQQRQEAQQREEERRQSEIDEINQMADGHFDRLSSADRMRIALRLTGRNLFGGISNISWPGWGGVARGAGHLAAGLIDPRAPLMGVIGGLNMIINGTVNFIRHPSWGGALKSAADITTGLTIILGSITALAAVIAAIMTAITILSFGTAAPITGPVIAFCATVMSTVGGWTITVGSIALLLQELVFLKNLYEAATAQTAEELQQQSDHMTEDARNAGNVVMQMGMAKLAQVGGRQMQSAIAAEGGGVAFARGMGRSAFPSRIATGVRQAGGVRAYAAEVAASSRGAVAEAGGVGRFAVRSVRSGARGVGGFARKTWHELTTEAPAGVSGRQGLSRDFLFGEGPQPRPGVPTAEVVPTGEAPVVAPPTGEGTAPTAHPTGEGTAPTAHPTGEATAPTAHPTGEVTAPTAPPTGEGTAPTAHPTGEATVPAEPPAAVEPVRPPETPAEAPPEAPAGTGEPTVSQQESELFEQTRSKTGAEMSPEEVRAELDAVSRRGSHPAGEGPYVEETELPNGHEWREREDGVFCRFSPGPGDCFNADGTPAETQETTGTGTGEGQGEGTATGETGATAQTPGERRISEIKSRVERLKQRIDALPDGPQKELWRQEVDSLTSEVGGWNDLGLGAESAETIDALAESEIRRIESIEQDPALPAAQPEEVPQGTGTETGGTETSQVEGTGGPNAETDRLRQLKAENQRMMEPIRERINAETERIEALRNRRNAVDSRPSTPEEVSLSPSERARIRAAERAKISGQIARAEERLARLRQELEPLTSRDAELAGSIRQIEANRNWGRHQYDDLGSEIEPCFVAGTLVKTPSGDRPIESLTDGEQVLAYDFVSGQVVARPIARAMKNWTLNLVDITVAGETVTSTRRHPFWANDAWRHASELREGMLLRSWNGEEIPILHANTYAREIDTYNLEVEGLHNYFVGISGLLVHNGDDSGFTNTTRRPTEIYAVRNANGEIIYVGKTVQGIDVRLGQHVDMKSHWQGTNGQGVANRSIERLKSGNWDPYETAVWEQHYIEKYGGLGRSSPLENDVRAITEDKYDLYRDPKYGHNPCR